MEDDFLNPKVSHQFFTYVQHELIVYLYPKPFRLFKMVMEHLDFESVLADVWTRSCHGIKQFKLSKKLKLLKTSLKKSNKYVA